MLANIQPDSRLRNSEGIYCKKKKKEVSGNDYKLPVSKRKMGIARVWLQHGQLHIQSTLRKSLGLLHLTERESGIYGFVCLTQVGNVTLKVMLVIETVSEDTHNTRLGMLLSQSCRHFRLHENDITRKDCIKAHDKARSAANDGKLEL
jgi:hypothetical protein